MTLRSRMFAGFALVLVALVVVGAVVVASQRRGLIGQIDRQLESVVPLNRTPPDRPADELRPEPPDERVPDAPISDLYLARVSPTGTIEELVLGQLLEEVPAIDIEPATVAVREFTEIASADGSVDFRALIDPAREGPDVVVIALPLTDVNDSIRQLVTTIVLLGVFVTAILGLIAWWIARLGLRPISEMTATAAAIAAGDREQRVPDFDRHTEAGQLGAAFNEMLDQRDGADERLRRFVSDASHELRTPLTSIRGYLDLYAQGGFREQEQLDDIVRRMQDETARMSGLTESLLELARMDEGVPLHLEDVDVRGLIDDVVADSRAAHPDLRIDGFTTGSAEPARLDRHKIQQLLTGLVANAVAHAPGASVTVAADYDADRLLLSVSDDGPGLAEEQAAHVFERFYRGDADRARSSGGSGLGLSIAKSIAEAHGGSIAVQTAEGEGCAFVVTVPV